MKHQNATLPSRLVILFTVLFFSSLLLFCMLAMRTKQIADDLWQQLGISQVQANQNINYSFNYGQLSYLGAKNAKNIASGDRVSIVNELVAYSKKYMAGDQFKLAYENFRNGKKPAQPYLYTISVDSIRTAEKERIEKQIKITEANVNSPNPKIRNGVPYALENLNKQLKDLDNPENRTIKSRVDNMKQSNDNALKFYNNAMQKFESDYPANPQQILKKRLQAILDITADVDYSAELKDAGKFKVFVNPVYESKPKEWKLAYRAGKTTTDAIRKLAQDWLNQLK